MAYRKLPAKCKRLAIEAGPDVKTANVVEMVHRRTGYRVAQKTIWKWRREAGVTPTGRRIRTHPKVVRAALDLYADGHNAKEVSAMMLDLHGVHIHPDSVIRWLKRHGVTVRRNRQLNDGERAEVIRRLRVRTSSKTQIAREMGICHSTVSRIAEGRRRYALEQAQSRKG